MSAPGGEPRVLVLGGTGSVGAGVVETARAHGLAVTAVARSAPDADTHARLFGPGRARFAVLDVTGSGADDALLALLEEHDLVVLAHEPWVSASATSDVTRGAERLYALAAKAGFEVESNRHRRASGTCARRLVRIGSCAAERPLGLLGSEGSHQTEDVPLDRVEAHHARDPASQHGYFRAKVALARAAERAVARGLDVVTALPTWVLSEWGDRGGQEPLVHAHRAARTTGFVPSVPLNVVPSDVVGEAILILGRIGRTGHAYPITGVETDTCALHALSLGHLGHRPRPFPVPRAELLDEMRLLVGRPRGNPLLDLWLLPWDVTRRVALRRFGIEAWHLAVLLEGAGRSDAKLRALIREHETDCAPLRLPERDEIAGRLARIGRRKAERMQRSGAFAPPELSP